MKKYFWTGLPVILIIGALVGGVFIYKSGATKPKITQEELSLVQSPTEISEPTPELKREDLKLKVLNGRGVAGIAGEAKNYLESLGYKDVEVGNADSYAYQQTEISIKKDKEPYLELLITDLSDGFRVSEKTETLATESEFDAVITIGKE
jgi:hypothetical protein